MIINLSLLYPSEFYPYISGGYLRTLSIARLAYDCFKNVTLFATDEKSEYQGFIDNVRIVQEKKINNCLNKSCYFMEGVFFKNFSLKVPKSALFNKDNSLFQLESPYFYNLLKKNSISKFILNEHNIYRDVLKFPSNNLKEILINNIAYNRNKQIEIEDLTAASHILVCSEHDKIQILNLIPHTADKITVILNCVFESEYNKYIEISFVKNEVVEELSSVLFIGSLLYPPNLDAIRIICSLIAPNFGNEVQFYIIGNNPPNIQWPSNVTFLGYVDDIKENIMKCCLCIAPLRYGSGTRFKILEYMAMGKLVISTSKGAEGIDYTENKNIIIKDDLNAFSEKIRIILDDKKLRNNLGKNALMLIKQKYDGEIYRKTLHNVYKKFS